MEAKRNTPADHFAKQAALTTVLILSKLLKDESLKEFKETIIKYQYLAPHFEKKNGKKKVVLASLRSSLVLPR